MRSFVAFLLSAMLGGSPVLAADFPLPAGEPIRAPVAYNANGPYTNWAGAYLGINGGFGLGSSQWTLGLMATDVFDTNGFLFGGTVGFNYPVSAVLFGLEADVDWSQPQRQHGRLRRNHRRRNGGLREQEQPARNGARPRGLCARPRRSIYVTGGAAFGPVQTGLIRRQLSTPQPKWAGRPAPASSMPLPVTGAPRPNISLSISAPPPARPPPNCGSATGSSVTLTENLMRGGVNYRFSW